VQEKLYNKNYVSTVVALFQIIQLYDNLKIGENGNTCIPTMQMVLNQQNIQHRHDN